MALTDYVIMPGADYQALVDKIKEKTGKTDPLVSGQLAAELDNVTGSGDGGGVLPSGNLWGVIDVKSPNSYYQTWFDLNGETYAAANAASGNACLQKIYKLTDRSWTTIISLTSPNTSLGNSYALQLVEYGGVMHFFGNESKAHYTFDGINFNQKANLPNSVAYRAMFIQGGQLKAYSFNDGSVYVWDESADTWTQEAVILSKHAYRSFVNVNGVVYTNKGEIYQNGALVSGGITFELEICQSIGNKVYSLGRPEYTYTALYEIDVQTGENRIIRLPGGDSYSTIWQNTDSARVIVGGNGIGNAVPLILQ